MGYNNSAKAKMIRVAADEKDKKYASAAGKRALNKDIESMINYGSPNKNIGPQGLGVKGNNGYTIGSEGPLLKPKLGSHSIHKHMGGSAFKLVDPKQVQDTVQYVKDLQNDMPIDKDATGGRNTLDAINKVSMKSNKFVPSDLKTKTKTEPKDNSRKAIKKRKTADKAAGVSKSQMRANKAKSKSEAALEKAKKAKNPSYRAQLKRKSDRLAKRAERKGYKN